MSSPSHQTRGHCFVDSEIGRIWFTPGKWRGSPRPPRLRAQSTGPGARWPTPTVDPSQPSPTGFAVLGPSGEWCEVSSGKIHPPSPRTTRHHLGAPPTAQGSEVSLIRTRHWGGSLRCLGGATTGATNRMSGSRGLSEGDLYAEWAGSVGWGWGGWGGGVDGSPVSPRPWVRRRGWVRVSDEARVRDALGSGSLLPRRTRTWRRGRGGG